MQYKFKDGNSVPVEKYQECAEKLKFRVWDKLKKQFILIQVFCILIAVSVGCQKTYTQTEVDQLNQLGKTLSEQVKDKNKQLYQLNKILEEKNTDIAKRNAELDTLLKDERTYIIKLSFSTVTVTLDMWEHMKNAANAGEFEIPVDRNFYNNVKVGDNLVDVFKVGSFLRRGSFSGFEFYVTGKRIE